MANDWKKTARGQALEVLEEVFQEGAYSNIALNAHLSKSRLTDKDKALVTEIVYGTVARKITLEWVCLLYTSYLNSYTRILKFLSLVKLSLKSCRKGFIRL